MRTDNLGIPVYSNKDVIDMIYEGRSDLLDFILADPEDQEIVKYNQTSDKKINIYTLPDLDQADFDAIMQSSWYMPDEYKNMDIEEFLINLCPEQNYQRLADELQEFQARNMLDLMRWLKYFIDTCRNNNILWGVGRGSSVASYALYLLEVHKIDSVQYNLDWREFLR